MPMILPPRFPLEVYYACTETPEALLMLYERLFGAPPYSTPAEVIAQQRTIDRQAKEIKRLGRKVEALKVEVEELKHRGRELQRRIAELEALARKDSRTSHRPPSSDQPAIRRTRSLRVASGKGAGGQLGHRGHTRPLVARPQRVISHARPAECRRCRQSLTTAPVVRCERRQVVDIIPAKLRVSEHRVETVRCMRCGKEAKGSFPQGVAAAPVQYGASVKARAVYLRQYQLLSYERTKEAMRDLFGCELSAGTIANIVRRCADDLVETELAIKDGLRHSALIHADETGLRVAKHGHYVHVASNSRLTHYSAHRKRGREAIDEANILSEYRGTLVHDGWHVYEDYEGCRHALCGSHILRELQFFGDLGGAHKAWAAPIKELLLEIKAAVEAAVAGGGRRLGAGEQAVYAGRYDELIERGEKINPLGRARFARRKRSGKAAVAAEEDVSAAAAPPAKVCQQQARRLLQRLRRRKDEVLLFMTDARVPFSNNQAERDLRMIKLQQKTSGCFRSEDFARAFCRTRSYLSTIRKQGRRVICAIEAACRAAPYGVTRRAAPSR